MSGDDTTETGGEAEKSVTERDIGFIRALGKLMREQDLTEIEVEREYGDDDELKVRLSRVAPMAAPAPQAALARPQTAPAALADAGAAATEAPIDQPTPAADHAIRSPMVGTVYLAPEPGAGAFIALGDQVAEGQTLLIIEAMKTMNQIPSPRAGTVREILVSNAEPVEFGAPLVVIS